MNRRKPTSKTKLMNARLEPELVEMLADLRRHGKQFSDIVRRAIRAEHATTCRHRRPRTPEEMSAVLQEIYERNPLPPDLPPLPFKLTDGRAMSEHFRAHLERKQERIRQQWRAQNHP